MFTHQVLYHQSIVETNSRNGKTHQNLFESCSILDVISHFLAYPWLPGLAVHLSRAHQDLPGPGEVDHILAGGHNLGAGAAKTLI